jgi:hypothetical protein
VILGNLIPVLTIENLIDGAPIDEVEMDLTNNKKGREAAEEDEDVLEKAENGELETLNEGGDKDYGNTPQK